MAAVKPRPTKFATKAAGDFNFGANVKKKPKKGKRQTKSEIRAVLEYYGISKYSK